MSGVVQGDPLEDDEDVSEFAPDWVSAPGDTISDLLRRREMLSTVFAERMQMTQPEVVSLLEGHTKIDHAIANKLSEVLGASAQFWLAREANYRRDLVRLGLA